MGLPLTPIVVKQAIDLDSLRGKLLAVDGNGELYQFLALIRLPDGTPLQDKTGRITSHLAGLFYRATRLIADHGVRLVYVFDGAPPALKRAEVARRRAVRERYEEELAEARAAGDLARAYSKSTMTSRLTREMVHEAMTLLRLMGIPTVQAPSEGEAQAAHMARAGKVWAAASKDYDFAALRRAEARQVSHDFRQGVSSRDPDGHGLQQRHQGNRTEESAEPAAAARVDREHAG
jgi:flap endonuclease-1